MLPTVIALIREGEEMLAQYSYATVFKQYTNHGNRFGLHLASAWPEGMLSMAVEVVTMCLINNGQSEGRICTVKLYLNRRGSKREIHPLVSPQSQLAIKAG